MSYIKVNGIKIAFETFGDKRNKPLFLIHGLTGQRMSNYSLASKLKNDYFIITYDCRGHGQSDHPQSFTLLDHGKDMIALIDAFGYKKASVFGLSAGSYVAAQAAILKPESIDKLILAATKAYDDGTGSSTARVLKENGVSINDIPPEHIIYYMDKAMWSPETSEERKNAIRIDMSKDPNYVELTSKEIAAINKSLMGFDLRPYLHNITAKTLVISGKYDGLNPSYFGKEVSDSIPGSKFVIMKHSGHIVTDEEPAKFIEILKEFLAS